MRQLRFIGALATSSMLALWASGCTTNPDDVTISYAETVQPLDGTAIKSLTVVTAAAQCPLATDCSRSWTDRYVKAVFQDHDPDIVVMTEMFWNGTYDNTIAQVNRVRPNVYNFYHGPNQGFLDGWGGTVIASKYVMTGKAEHEYESCLHPDCETDKGTIVARQHLGRLADGREITVDVLATHFQAKTIGDFVGVIGEQMGEQRDFLRGVWKGNDGQPGAALKIYSGDLNVAGDGPSWLATGGHSGADRRGRDKFNWLKDNVLLPYGLRDGLDTCAPGTDQASTCANRPFREAESGDVVKQFHTTSAELRGPKGESAGESVLLVPQKAEHFGTPSDHEAKLVQYALYKYKGTFTVEVKDGGAPSEDSGGHPRSDGGAPPTADGGAPGSPMDSGAAPMDAGGIDDCTGRADGETYCSVIDARTYYSCLAGDVVHGECAMGTHCAPTSPGATTCAEGPVPGGGGAAQPSPAAP